MASPLTKRADALPADGLLHPIPILCLLLLVLNDHFWKATYPGFWTGKLSDIAGLALVPLVLQAAFELTLRASGNPWGPSRRVLLWSTGLTAIGFAAIQVWPPATQAYAHGLGWLGWPARAAISMFAQHAVTAPGPVHITADPSDLWALPAALLALLAGWRRGGY